MKQNAFKIIITCLFTAVIAFSVKTACAAAPPMSVTIDGNLTDAAWQHARAIGPFTTQKGDAPPVTTTGKVLTDDTYIYFAFICEEPQMDMLQAVKKPRDGDIWSNDCIEIYVASLTDKNAYFHIAVDTAGQVYDAFDKNALYTLDVTAKTRKEKNGWTMEVAIPLSNLGLNNNRAALLSVGRERKPAKELSSWHGWFHQPETWQSFPLSLNAARSVAVDAVSFAKGTPQYGDNTANISFTSNADTSVKVLLYARQNGKWTLKEGRTVRMVQGREMSIALPLNLSKKENPNAVRWVIDGKNNTLFSLTRPVHLPDNEFIATLQSPYYYTNEKYGTIQVKTFLSPMTIKETSLELTVKDPSGNLRQFKKITPLKPLLNVGLDISSWQEGDGAVFMELKDGDKMIAHQRIVVPKRPGPIG